MNLLKKLLAFSLLGAFWACTPSAKEPVAPIKDPAQPTTEPIAPVKDVSTFTEKDLRYKGGSIRLTRHARCRMECRTISLKEIQEVLDQGKINERKSDPNAKPCPTWSYEGRTREDAQMLRVVVGDCNPDTRVVTVIDLENKYECDCN